MKRITEKQVTEIKAFCNRQYDMSTYAKPYEFKFDGKYLEVSISDIKIVIFAQHGGYTTYCYSHTEKGIVSLPTNHLYVGDEVYSTPLDAIKIAYVQYYSLIKMDV